MEMVAGEIACYKLLTFTSLKTMCNVRSTKVSKVRLNLPYFEKVTQKIYTILKFSCRESIINKESREMSDYNLVALCYEFCNCL